MNILRVWYERYFTDPQVVILALLLVAGFMVAIYFGDDTDFPNGTALTTSDLIDAVVYDTDDADDPGLLVLLKDLL